MSKVLLVSDKENQNKEITKILSQCSLAVITLSDEPGIISCVERRLVQLIIIDAEIKSLDAVILCKKLQSIAHKENIILLSLINQNTDASELLKLTSAYVTKPIIEKILIATVTSNLKLKKAIDTLSKSNSELAKSLYQLDVLYNTSTQLAGSLDKQKLINIMIDGLEKSLSFSLSSTLVFNSEHDIDLIINSLYGISPRLEHSLKLRAILSYRALFDKKRIPYDLNVSDIKVIKNIKHPLEEYDLNILKFDNLFAPINVGEKFFGLIEVFRENDFTQEDTTCFQTLARQVSLPLENASLYEEIKKTNTKLEKLERLKSEFISIVSHELRTPLTAIKNSLEICLSGKAGEVSTVMDKFLNMAKRNVTRLSGIINDLLDLSKVEAGKMDFKFEKSNINTPVEFMKNTFENVAKEKNIDLILEKEDDISDTYFDSQRIEQVMSNLISNAIKFTNEGGKIIVKTENIKECDIEKHKLIGVENPILYDRYIKVSVTDSGIGIAAEDLKKVFDQFQQIENSLNRKNGGTGLGLPIAKQLIEAHKGFIWVESEVNRGTTFSFVIPILSEKEKFILDLDKDIQKAKTCSHNLLLLMIQENESTGYSFIENVKSEKISIIRKTANTKEVYFNEDGKNCYAVILPEADKFAQSFIEKKIESTIEQNTTSLKKYDILYSTALFPDSGKDAAEMIETAEKLLKKNNKVEA
ncbi:MAG: hypothetical protein KHX03_00560 [Clostridium sp.]|nr:hypothetical protein [Clostridium sp.]